MGLGASTSGGGLRFATGVPVGDVCQRLMLHKKSMMRCSDITHSVS